MNTCTLCLQCDFHIHTHLSGCARRDMFVPFILDVCRRRGLKRVGVCDHIFPDTDLRILKASRDEIVGADVPMDVYLGCEADILSVGRHTATDEVISQVDYVIGSANHYQLPWVDQPSNTLPETVARHFLDMFAYACSLECVDIIAHPMCDVSGKYDASCLNLLSDSDIGNALEQARVNGIAMEISPRALSRDDDGFRMRFYRLCREHGLRFSFGSDAHSLQWAGRVDVLRELIDQLGITDDEVWLPSVPSAP